MTKDNLKLKIREQIVKENILSSQTSIDILTDLTYNRIMKGLK